MTLGYTEDCPECGHSGGYPQGIESQTIVTMLCPNCLTHYQMSTEKEQRPNQ